MPRTSSSAGPIRRSYGFRHAFRTMSALADALRKDSSLPWQPSLRSISNELARLDRGDGRWWAPRPDHAARLAELLGIDVDDLGLAAGAPAAHELDFPGFPGFPVVDLRNDDAWDIGRPEPAGGRTSEMLFPAEALSEWLDPSPSQWRPPNEWEWLCIADELERHAVVRRIAVKGQWDIAEAETLGAIAQRLSSPKPLVVVLKTLEPLHDAAVLAGRPGGAGLLVVAPGLWPVRAGAADDDDFGWERQHLTARERVAYDLSHPNPEGFGRRLRRWTWRRPERWRAGFLRWVERHLARAGRDSLYTASTMIDWLERFDPQEEWFHGPADLLALCLNFENEHTLPPPHDPQAGRRLAAVLDRQQPPMLARAMDAIGHARWRNADVAWSGGLPLAVWQSWLPPVPAALPDAERKAILSARTEAARAARWQAWEARTPSVDPQTLHALLSLHDGGYDFRHRAVAQLSARYRLMEEMQQASLSGWAGACFDAERCRLVDAALDAVSWETLGALADRLAQPGADDADHIGAAEALFCALGRRFVQLEARQVPAAHLAPLARRVVGRLDLGGSEWTLPAPWSRPVDTPERQIDWIGACWGWSLVLLDGMPQGQWLFPGWTAAGALPDAPGWLADVWPEKGTTQLSAAWIRFFGAVDAWVQETSEPRPDAPRFLHMAYLAEAGRGAWPAQAAWWTTLSDGPDTIAWADDALIGRLDALAAPARLWNSYVQAESAMSGLQRLGWLRRPLRAWMLEAASGAALIDATDDAGIRYLAHRPHTLPPACRGPLLLRFGAQVAFWWPGDFPPAWFRRYGPGAADALERLLSTHPDFAWHLAPMLWELQPERAMAGIAAQDGSLSAQDRAGLVRSCPEAYRRRVVEVLQAQPRLLPADECRAWVHAVLPGSGALAPPLLALLAAVDGGDTPNA